MTDAGTFALERFITAQEPVYEDVCAELAAGRKTSHWMWFIFPQLRLLGRSGTARFYGIESEGEAVAYWSNALLRSRLQTCTEVVLRADTGRTAHDIFGTPDDLKLRSCMTLFEIAATEEPIFGRVLERF